MYRLTSQEVQREGGFLGALNPMALAPSALFLWLSQLLHAAHPVSRGGDGGTPLGIHQKDKEVFAQPPSKSQAGRRHPQLRTARGAQCPWRQVWRCLAAGRYLNKAGIKKEEGRSRPGWAARKVCPVSHSRRPCREAAVKAAQKMLSC